MWLFSICQQHNHPHHFGGDPTRSPICVRSWIISFVRRLPVDRDSFLVVVYLCVCLWVRRVQVPPYVDYHNQVGEDKTPLVKYHYRSSPSFLDWFIKITINLIVSFLDLTLDFIYSTKPLILTLELNMWIFSLCALDGNTNRVSLPWTLRSVQCLCLCSLWIEFFIYEYNIYNLIAILNLIVRSVGFFIIFVRNI